MNDSSPSDLSIRLDRIEQQLERMEAQLANTSKGGGGIGCLGVVLLLFLFSRASEILEVARQILGHVAP